MLLRYVKNTVFRVTRRRNTRYLIGFLLVGFIFYQLLLIGGVNLADNNGKYSSANISIKKCRQVSRFVYVKMIKCASTTLSGMFRRFGIVHNLTFVLPPKGKIYIGWPYQIDETFYRPLKSASQFDILCEHAVFNATAMDRLMGPNVVYLTSLREPFAQFKSMVNYYSVLNISRVPIDIPDRFAEYLSNIERYEKNYKSPSAVARYCVPDGFSMTRNLMSFNLGFPTGGFLSAETDQSNNMELIAEWIAMLDSKFSLVMIVEHFVESLVLLRRQMCWKLEDILYHSSNSLSYNYRSKNDEHLVDIYKQWSRVDYALYEHFNKTLWKKISLQDTGFWEEVEHVRRTVADIETFCATTKESAEDEDRKLVISESKWSESILITGQFCRMFSDSLFDELQSRYERLPPLNMAENEPSKYIC